jgi:hypothetical protein
MENQMPFMGPMGDMLQNIIKQGAEQQESLKEHATSQASLQTAAVHDLASAIRELAHAVLSHAKHD